MDSFCLICYIKSLLKFPGKSCAEFLQTCMLELIKLLVVLNYLYIVHFLYVKVFTWASRQVDNVENFWHRILRKSGCKQWMSRKPEYTDYHLSPVSSTATIYVSNFDMNLLRRSIYELFRRGEDFFLTRESGTCLKTTSPTQPRNKMKIFSSQGPRCETQKRLTRRHSCTKCGKHVKNRSNKNRSLDAYLRFEDPFDY